LFRPSCEVAITASGTLMPVKCSGRGESNISAVEKPTPTVTG